MRMRYFGDSYDIVKRSLLGWLAPGEAWSVQPMFTEPVAASDAAAFARFLGASLLTTEPLMLGSDRNSYFSCAATTGHVFFDPNTGVRLRAGRGARDPDYLYSDELLDSINARPESLTLVFDKSVPRGREHRAVSEKLQHFTRSGTAAFAYVSHACFLVLSAQPDVVSRARKELLGQSRLPEGRIVETPAV